MARKPNYDFERRERERLKAVKQAERQKAKAEKATKPEDGAEPDGAEPDGTETQAENPGLSGTTD